MRRPGAGGGIGAIEDDLASALRQDRVRKQHQILGVVRDTLPRIVEEKRSIDVEDHPQKVVVGAGQKEDDLDIVAPGIAETARAEGRSIGQRRCAQTTAARLPLGEPLFRRLLQGQ